MITEKKIVMHVSSTKVPTEADGVENYLRCVYSDKSRFLQIMLNFLSNAIKFTPEGGSV